MGDIPQSNLTELLNLQFSTSDQFNPYEMSGESAYRMLLELKQNCHLSDKTQLGTITIEEPATK